MAEGDKRRTPSREVPSTGKMRECSAREGRMYPFGGLDRGTDARRTLGGPISSHQAAGARPKTGLLSGPSSSTTSGRSMLPYVVGSRTEKAKMVPTLLFGSRETSHRHQTSSLEKNGKRGSIRESPKTTYGTGDLRYDFEPQGTVIRAQIAPCLYCKGSHGFAECSKFAKLPQEMKLETIRKAGLCFACLDKGHCSRNCSSKLICSICAEKKREKYHPKILHQMSPDEIIEQAFIKKRRQNAISK